MTRLFRWFATNWFRLRFAIQLTGAALVFAVLLAMAALVATADGEPVTCKPFVIHTIESSSK